MILNPFILMLQGVAALLSPNTGIVDWGLIARVYGKKFEENGGSVVRDYEVRIFLSDSDPPSKIVQQAFSLDLWI